MAEPERLVLASRSPQRRAILEQLGVPFEVRPADVAEENAGPPQAVACENALRKALAVAGDRPHDVVLGVDTLVATGHEIWGKPPTAEAARETLARGALVQSATAVTEVTFRPLDDRMVDWYLATGEWEGRAGGYAIQGRGAALVTAVAGDYLNVVGLPVAALLDLWPEVIGPWR